jgi:hypothetical protein
VPEPLKTSANTELHHLRVHLNPEVMAQRMGDDLVLVHLSSNQIFELSSSAAQLWELLESGLGLAEALQQLLADYDVTPAHLEEDILKTLRTLEIAKLVELRSYAPDTNSRAP